MIKDLATAGALPTLELAIKFAGQRQKLIANNIANFETPDYRQVDVSPRGFQAQLGAAIDRRRRTTGGTHGEVGLRRSREVWQDDYGNLRLEARSTSGNILSHDRNDRDLERTMQDMVENEQAMRIGTTFVRRQVELLRSAIAERA